MMKRLTWFMGGVAAGAIGAGRAKRKVRSVAAELTPLHVARRTTEHVRRRGQDVAEAVREGRRAMRMKELQLRSRIDGAAAGPEGRVSTLADELDGFDGDTEVIVDGQPVEPGQVIVLRQVRDGDRTPRRAGPRRRA